MNCTCDRCDNGTLMFIIKTEVMTNQEGVSHYTQTQQCHVCKRTLLFCFPVVILEA